MAAPSSFPASSWSAWSSVYAPMVTISEVGAIGLDLCMPPICVHCRARRWGRAPLCLACMRNLEPLRPPLCGRCGLPDCESDHSADDFPFAAAQFLFRMSPELSTLVHGFK